MGLVDFYLNDVAGLPYAEAQERRKLWHHLAKLFLVQLSITSDTVEGYPVEIDATTGLETVIRPYMPFWRQWAPLDFARLYRATKKLKLK